MNGIEIAGAFSSKFYMLCLVLADWDMSGAESILVNRSLLKMPLPTGKVKYQQPEARGK